MNKWPSEEVRQMHEDDTRRIGEFAVALAEKETTIAALRAELAQARADAAKWRDAACFASANAEDWATAEARYDAAVVRGDTYRARALALVGQCSKLREWWQKEHSWWLQEIDLSTVARSRADAAEAAARDHHIIGGCESCMANESDRIAAERERDAALLARDAVACRGFDYQQERDALRAWAREFWGPQEHRNGCVALTTDTPLCNCGWNKLAALLAGAGE